jgi:hypothetical protein
MWLFTVSSVSESSAAIILFALPLAINRSTSISRGVNASSVLDDFGRDLRGDAFLAGMDCANCLQQFLS